MSRRKTPPFPSTLDTRHSLPEPLDARLHRALTGSSLSTVDRHLCQELVYGVVRWQATLDRLISRKTKSRITKPDLQNILRLGLYQVFWLERIPAHAAVHESVELAKQTGHGSQSGFVNAVLRGYVREQEETRALLDRLKREQPALGYSHPEWLVSRWAARWGPENTRALLEWNNTPPKTFARVNTLKTDPAKLLARWQEEGVGSEPVQHDWIEQGLLFQLVSHPPLTDLASFQDGWFYVQDPSTLLAVHELAPRPGETILDFCAAPGGKLTLIAQVMRNDGRLIAQDLTPARIELVKENCARLGVTNVECRVSSVEGTGTPSLRPSTLVTRHSSLLFDRILLDAPCSNTGVMRRRVDLRWRIRPEEIERLRALQLDLLAQAAPLLKPGGWLVYSTCSLEPEENEQVVEAFLRENPGFKLQSERQLLPFNDKVDGAYVVTLIKE